MILNTRKDSLTSNSIFSPGMATYPYDNRLCLINDWWCSPVGIKQSISVRTHSLQTLTRSHQNNHGFFKKRYVKQSNHMNNNSESEFRPYRLCSTKTPNHITTKPIMTWSFEIKSTKKALGYCPGLHIEKKKRWNQTFRPTSHDVWCHLKTSVGKLPNNCVY